MKAYFYFETTSFLYLQAHIKITIRTISYLGVAYYLCYAIRKEVNLPIRQLFPVLPLEHL